MTDDSTRRRARRPRRRRSGVTRGAATFSVLLAVVALPLSCRGGAAPVSPLAGDGTCLYSGARVDQLDAFGAAVGRPFECAVVFNNAAPTWADLVAPWFVSHRDPNRNWAAWRRAEPGRRLVVSQALVPDRVPTDWRERGAAGEYDGEARTLATNLVAAGLGDSVIRLSHESNGLWTKDGLGPDPAEYGAWRATWRRFAAAMRSVRGAAFQFDWTVNAGVRPVPFDAYYPGDDVVDIIGVDIYDFWDEPNLGPAPADPQTRWDVRYREPGGVGELTAFATAHGKPLSIPEWGLSAVGVKGGVGDNPTFVENVARLVHDRHPVYQAYFEATTDVAMLLTDAPRSFAIYRSEFGTGDASAAPAAG